MYITVLGTFGTGKSAIASSLAINLGIDLVSSGMIGKNKNIDVDNSGMFVIIGKYRKRFDGSYTGGLDTTKSQEDRFRLLKNEWLNKKRKIIIGESHMTFYWSSFWKRIKEELLPKVSRKILIIHLSSSKSILKARWSYRSGNTKAFTKTQNESMSSKIKNAQSIANKINSKKSLKKKVIYKEFRSNKPKDLKKVLFYVAKKIKKIENVTLGNNLIVSDLHKTKKSGLKKLF